MTMCLCVCVLEPPGKQGAVRVMRCLTTSVQLGVEPPPYAQGPPVTGYLVVNELQANHVNLGNRSTICTHASVFAQREAPVASERYCWFVA